MTELPSAPHQHAAPLRPWYVSLIFALVAVTLLLGGVWLYTRLKNPFPFYGTTYTPPQPARLFSGTDQTNQPYTFSPQGKTTALFFGFTHCPNICPVTLAYLEKLRQSLPSAERERFQVVLVSLDPERDTPAVLKSYVSFFGPATGVQVKEPALAELARSYGAAYTRAALKGAGDYQINHTTATYLIDSAWQLRLIWDYTQLPSLERLRADVQEVMR